jgi:hypothetical protein
MLIRSTAILGLVLLGAVASADELKSGPQVGDGIPGGFSSLFVNGEHADKNRCPV